MGSTSSTRPTAKKKVLFFTLTIILFGFGYLIAPPEMEEGEYSISLSIQREGVTSEFLITFKVLDNPTNTSLITTSLANNGISLVAIYSPEYSRAIDERITFSFEVVEDNLVITREIMTATKIEVRGDNFQLTTSLQKEGDGRTANVTFRPLRYSKLALGLLFGIAFLWLTEFIPLAAASLIIPVVSVVFKLDTANDSLSPFFSSIIVLFFAGFLLAMAMRKTKLDTWISLQILSRIPAHGKVLILTMMVMSAVFSMFMSNTAAAAVLIPLAITLMSQFEGEYGEFRKTLVLSIAYSATLGGIGSLIGTPPNIIAADLAQEFNGAEISFVEWFYFGLPVVAIMIPVIFVYIILRFKPSIPSEKIQLAKDHALKELKAHGRLNKDQFAVGIVFIGIFILWLTERQHGVKAGIVALAGVVILFFTGQLVEDDILEVNWNVLLTFGGGIALGNVILHTGLAEWMASTFYFIRDYPPALIIIVLGGFALILTAIASNTASAAILIPIVMPMGAVLGFNPAVLAIYIAIVCSVDFAIIIGTPPTMLAFSTGYFNVKEIFKIGIVLDVIGWLVVSALTLVLYQSFVGVL